jgi:hypothetical protein
VTAQLVELHGKISVTSAPGLALSKTLTSLFSGS